MSIGLVLVAACSPKELGDMKKKAKEVTATAEVAAKRADATIQIKREVDAIDLQAKMYAYMKVTFADAELVALARIYYRAFEFQKWSGETSDTLEYKEELYRKSMYIFFPLVSSLMPNGFPLKQHLLSHSWRRLGVLASQMDEVDPGQAKTASAHGTIPESMHSLIERALLTSTVTSPYAREVRAWRPEAVYLLQVRYAYLWALATERLTGVEFGYAEQLDPRYPWVSPKTDITPELIEEARSLIAKARQQATVLRALGAEVVIHPTIARRVRNVAAALPEATAVAIFGTSTFKDTVE